MWYRFDSGLSKNCDRVSFLDSILWREKLGLDVERVLVSTPLILWFLSYSKRVTLLAGMKSTPSSMADLNKTRHHSEPESPG